MILNMSAPQIYVTETGILFNLGFAQGAIRWMAPDRQRRRRLRGGYIRIWPRFAGFDVSTRCDALFGQQHYRPRAVLPLGLVVTYLPAIKRWARP